MTKRLFVSIPLSEYFHKVLTGYQGDYSVEGIRWTIPENLHITVYFLGDTEESVMPRITEKLEELFLQIPSFDLEFDKISLAPPHRPPSMIWAVFGDAGGAYKALADKVYGALEEFSARDNRNKESIPHITLARFRNPSIAREIKIIQPNTEHTVTKVSSCDLMESKLARTGSTYSSIKSFSLK